MEFLARQEGLAGCSKLTFLKTLAKHVATDPTFVALFLNEARIAARLSHPNIVQIYELGEVKGEYFIAMEHVHGHHLGTVLKAMRAKSQSFLPVLAAQLCTQVLLGLRYAHTLEDEQGRPLNLVHKNLCPSNVLLGFNGAVKICNFGIPFLKAGSKPALYVAPEQGVGGRIDARVDVYAAGVLLAELLLGKFPHNCNTGEQLAKSLSQHPGVPPALTDIVHCALAAKRDDRFESAREMALALEYHIEAAGASQVTVELAHFLRQLFGTSTSNPWLSYEVGFLADNTHAPSSSKASASPALPPSQEPATPPHAKEAARPLAEKTFATQTMKALFVQEPLYLYFAWLIVGLWALGVCGIVWWLLHA
jgi:serine/threonine-protein kinase